MKLNSFFNNKFTSWTELENAIESIELAKEKGDIFEEFVYAYFLYFKDIYQISEIYMGRYIPDEVKNRIKLEKRDSGVDGIIIKDDATIIAYQAKFRSNRSSPSYDELTSFWAESEHAEERCIFANSYSLPKQAYKKKNQFTILRSELNSLENNFFEWLYLFATTGKHQISTDKYSPKPHQDKIIKDVLEGFETEDRGKLLAACGTGKTLTSLWIKENMGANKVLFVAPNLALIKQTLESWMPQADEPFSYLCVCSDTTVADNIQEVDHNESDEFLTDSTYIDVPVTTDPDKILKFLQSKTKKDKVIFSTYQSLDSIVSALEKYKDFEFDITFFDESHRTAGSKDTKMFVVGMYDEFIKSKKRLFMTATERFVNPRIVGRAKEYNYEIFSMDNLEQYGPTFTSLPFRAAIEQDIISDYKIVLCCMKEGEIKSIVDNNLLLNVGDRKVDSQNLFKQVLLAKTMNDLGISKAISYHKDIKSAQNFINSEEGTNLSEVIAAINTNIAVPDAYSDHINGTMSAGTRKEIFDEFISSPFGIISNARCLTEGVDVPVIDAVYFADPKNSIIDIIQAVGRSLRKVKSNPNKISYIIIPMIIADEISDFEDINPEEFNTLHTVVQALRDQDRILADYIDKLNLKLAKGKKPDKEPTNDIPLIIETSEELDVDDIANEILLRVAEVNKDPANISREFIFEPKARKAGVKRGDFITVGDYNLDSYWKSCVIATLDKYDNFNIGLPRTNIVVDNNNVSHAVKIGAIKEHERKFYVTDIGEKLYNCSDFTETEGIFQEQLLKFYKLSPITRIPQFPYRFALKVLSEVKSISRFEFAYAMFILKSIDDRGVSEALKRVDYLRETYPRIESLSESNKEIVLASLNEKYDTTLKIIDIWSSRTTLYNQYNYLKKHLSIWPSIFNNNEKSITLTADAAQKISLLLEKTNEIETCPMDRLTTLYTQYNEWLN